MDPTSTMETDDQIAMFERLIEEREAEEQTATEQIAKVVDEAVAKAMDKAMEQMTKKVHKDNEEMAKKRDKRDKEMMTIFLDDIRKEIGSANHSTGASAEAARRSAAPTAQTNPGAQQDPPSTDSESEDDSQQQQQERSRRGSREAAALYKLSPNHSIDFGGKKLWFLGSPYRSVDLTAVSQGTIDLVRKHEEVMVTVTETTKPESMHDTACLLVKKDRKGAEFGGSAQFSYFACDRCVKKNEPCI
jgi:hypothetical protein